MNKFYGKIGYSTTVETEPGVWEPSIQERTYRGEISSRFSRYNNSASVNDNINLNMQLSIIADPYALENYGNMVYVEAYNYKWKIENIELNNLPKMIITVGGKYNNG